MDDELIELMAEYEGMFGDFVPRHTLTLGLEDAKKDVAEAIANEEKIVEMQPEDDT